MLKIVIVFKDFHILSLCGLTCGLLLIFSVVRLRYCLYLWYDVMIWFRFGVVHFTAVIMPSFFLLTRFIDFMNFFVEIFFWLFIQENFLQITLHPELGKELKNQLLTGDSAWKSGKFYRSGIYSVPI
jgi:hypothetical protein